MPLSQKAFSEQTNVLCPCNTPSTFCSDGAYDLRCDSPGGFMTFLSMLGLFHIHLCMSSRLCLGYNRVQERGRYEDGKPKLPT